MIPNYIGAKTHFSTGESVLSPKALVKAAAKAGYSALAVADTNNINALPALFDGCREEGMKAIIGTSFQVVDDIAWRKAAKGEPKKKPNPFFRATLYAQNDQGVRNIMALLTIANDDDHFYMKPQVALEDVCATLEKGDVVLVLPAQYSVLAHQHCADKLKALADACKSGQRFIELSPINSAYYDKHNKVAIEVIAQEGSAYQPIVGRLTLNERGKVNLRNTLNCIMDHAKVTDPWRLTPNDSLHLMAPKELGAEILAMRDRLQRIPGVHANCAAVISASIRNAARFAELFELDWKSWDVSLPKMSDEPFEELVRLAKEGWKNRLAVPVMGYRPAPSKLPIYKERLNHELRILKTMGFENYFLLVRRTVNWARTNGILVGPGRGSAGGSLVAFLLGITDIDPIRFNLLFERFINPDRLDLPDVDLDFMSSRRQEVLGHLVNEYGADRVAGISNYVELGSSSALRQVGSAHNLSEEDFSCSRLVPKESGQPVSLEQAMTEVPEIERFALTYPDIWAEACGLQGALRNYGQHASGVIVAGDKIANRAVLQHSEGIPIVNWDMQVCERFGLVKLDVLGLSNLDVMRLAAEYIEESTGQKVDYQSVPLDDKKVLDAFGKAQTIGVFQFDGGGMRNLLKSLAQTDPLTFEDVVATTALFRPGPIQAGLMDDYVAIKQGVKMEDYLHPNMKPALEATRSVIVYQEQVMQIARDLAGFTLTEADHLRKAIGKKKLEVMAKMRQKFIDGCETHSGMPAVTASGLFDQIEKFAGYAFNKSHAVAYTVISYWTMWVKVNYPAEFFAAALSVLKDDKYLGLVKDAATFGIEIWPPDINVSTDRFEIVDFEDPEDGSPRKALVCPFQAIKGLSEKGSAAIIEARKKCAGSFSSKAQFLTTVNKRVCNIRVQETLEKVGAFANLPGHTGLPYRHPDRLRDQKQLLPGLIIDSVKADRKIEVSPYIKTQLVELTNEVAACERCTLAGTAHAMPRLGRSPKVLIATDYANWSETEPRSGEAMGRMGEGEASRPLIMAIRNAGLGLADCYLTSLVRATKPRGGEIANEMINGCSRYLDREIEILKPPVIVTLGSKVSRHILPELKGGWEELFGQEHYDAKRDATILVGFNYQMIAFDSSKQELLDELFRKVAILIS